MFFNQLIDFRTPTYLKKIDSIKVVSRILIDFRTATYLKAELSQRHF